MRCYRYMKFDYAEQSLKTKFFKVSRPSDFNDPFECRGRIVNVEIPLRSFVHENQGRLRNVVMAKLNEAGVTREVDQSILTEESLFQQYVETARRTIDYKLLRVIDKLWLMMCLVSERGTKPDTDVLFWSHYADSGRGVRVTLDVPTKSRIHSLYPVTYNKVTPVFDAAEMEGWLKGDKFNSFIKELTHTKGEAWKYENEVRMIIPRKLPYSFPDGKMHICEMNIEGKSLEFIQIDPMVVRRVDFGPRVDRKKSANLMDELHHSDEYAHVHFFETMFDSEKYAYQYKRIA